MLFHKILVVLDPNKTTQHALERVVRLIEEQKYHKPVEITVFMSAYDIAYEMSALLSTEEGDRMKATVLEQCRQAITPIIAPYQHLPNVHWDTIVMWNSNEADAITEAVKVNNFDLVVKHSQAKNDGFTALIFTPQDWQLLRTCPAPIMMVRDNAWQHQRRILVAVNVASDEANKMRFNDELVQLGLDIAHHLDRGNIHLVSAYPPSAINMSIDMPEFNNTQSEQSEYESYAKNMQTLREKFGIAEDHTHLVEGFPEEVIPESAKALDAELVILGSVGRTGLAGVFLGNTAEHVISKLHCNLLTIKPRPESKI